MRPCLHLANEFLFYILLNDLLEQSKNWSIHGLVRLGLPPAPHRATISYLAMSTSLSTAASDQLYFVWDSSRGKSSGSDHHLA